MRSTNKLISKYLEIYSEAESNTQLPPFWGVLSHCLVIPAYRESWLELQKVWSKLSDDLLIILVANSPDQNNPTTQKMITQARHASNSNSSHGNIDYLTTPCGKKILLVDRCSRPIPVRQGVGMARKIGADIALRLIHNKQIKSACIFNTDADVILPADYFTAGDKLLAHNPVNGQPIAAFVYPFLHQPAPQTEAACYLYEISLCYYVLGLRYAASPYAFSNVGSTIAINASNYAMVRGFPKRTAGEDFYLLNKLAKTGKIHTLETPVIHISGRFSDRVGFGTGLGIEKIHNNNNIGNNNNIRDSNQIPLFYNPVIFDLLKEFLADPTAYADTDSANKQAQNPKIHAWCDSVGLAALIKTRRNQRTTVFAKFIHDWMDGFRTMKFIHYMQDNYYQKIQLTPMLKADFISHLRIENKTDLKTIRNNIQQAVFATKH
ncbi:MAG: hypothetical protein KUG79_01705 [Pseudomonadales bacterium]|nr:hypothetical protein [Pseudomonadales bacterium]